MAYSYQYPLEMSMLGMDMQQPVMQQPVIHQPAVQQRTMQHPGIQQQGTGHDDGDQRSMPSTAPPPDDDEDTESSESSVVDTPTPGPSRHHKPTVDWKELDMTSILPQEHPPRVLMLPVIKEVSISPYGGEGCINNWVDVGMTDAPKGSKPAKLLAMAPTSEQVGCCIAYDEISCVLLFDPFHDRLILRNDSQHTIHATKFYGGDRVALDGDESVEIPSGEWQIRSAFFGTLVEFKVMGHTPYHIIPSLPTKRSSESPTSVPKKSRTLAGSTAADATTIQERSSKNPLLNLGRGEVISVGTGKDSYSLKRMAPISDQHDSDMWHARHSQMPDRLVVVKVHKCGSRYKSATVRSIENWMREVSIHSSLGSHNAILPYLGSDARFLSIYTEHVNSKDLTFHTGDNNKFNGTEMRAWTILGGVASALSFLHKNDILHGDIRLANILFDPVRGAVLKGFDHSSKDKQPTPNRDAPWYLSPEFMLRAQKRGFSSDMWALGIVMMWVLHALPMPEKQAHWAYEDIHRQGIMSDAREEAEATMMDWLALVRSSKAQLNQKGGDLAEIVDTLVQESIDARSDADTIVQRVRNCNLC
ncbi:kinase-like domain-containing protein [Xylaria sp. FL0043]|nr:kinase-like domain-containing protein [Xylaria sp. FL0043]